MTEPLLPGDADLILDADELPDPPNDEVPAEPPQPPPPIPSDDGGD